MLTATTRLLDKCSLIACKRDVFYGPPPLHLNHPNDRWSTSCLCKLMLLIEWL